MKISDDKSKTTVFQERMPVRSKIITEDRIIEQINTNF
jgi:hypothetical protein